MITMQEQLLPSTELSWKAYKPTTAIYWLHGENAYIQDEDQRAPAKGPAEIMPTAIFTITTGAASEWQSLEW